MSDVTNYLQAEVNKAQRTLRVAIIAMGVVLVVFFGYFQWLKSELATVLTPDSIAEFAINEARGSLPEISEALSSSLKSEAPNVVRFVLHQAVDHVLPLLGQSFEASLSEHARAVTEVTQAHTAQAFSATLARYKAERGKAAKKPVAVAELTTYMAARYPDALDDVAKAAIEEKLQQTGGTLKQIDARLGALAASRGESREDELGKRLITTWWTFLDRGQPKSADLALAESVKAPKK